MSVCVSIRKKVIGKSRVNSRCTFSIRFVKMLTHLRSKRFLVGRINIGIAFFSFWKMNVEVPIVLLDFENMREKRLFERGSVIFRISFIYILKVLFDRGSIIFTAWRVYPYTIKAAAVIIKSIFNQSSLKLRSPFLNSARQVQYAPLRGKMRYCRRIYKIPCIISEFQIARDSSFI